MIAAGGLALLAGAALLPDLLQRYATSRYLADVSPIAVLLAFLGAAGLRAAAHRPYPMDGIVAGFAGASVIVGVLLGVNGRYELLARHNPAIFAALGGNPPSRALGDDVVFNPLEGRAGDALAFGGFRFEPEAPDAGGRTTLVLWWRPLDRPPRLDRHAAAGCFWFPAGDGARNRISGRWATARAGGEWRESRFVIDLPADTPAPGYLAAELTLRDTTGQGR
ncbi:MAG: hypothetical protein KatS3mg060_0456 [Dehalococcoidia bacterium]|nr:MAG: hypothetical protein KatS3mg060_0456 [Dehalococcoidia bacterium]